MNPIQPPLVIAHRGDSIRAPENTLAAFRKAKEAGADWIELDLQYTADGQIICLHDNAPARTTDVARHPALGARHTVNDFSLAELGLLDAGSWFDPTFSGERIPTLAQVLAESRDGNIPGNLLIEIKNAPCYGSQMRALVEKLVRLLRSFGLPDSKRPFGGVILQSFHPEPLLMLTGLAPEFYLFQLAPPFRHFIPSRFPFFEAAMDWVFGYAGGIGLPDAEAKPRVVRTLHARNRYVFVWTVNDRERLRELAEMGVDGIITDDPAAALDDQRRTMDDRQ